MKRFSVLGLIICLIGCTTLQPVYGNRASLQQRLDFGEVLKPGDNVSILTKDGKTHDFAVKSVSASTIDGQKESISIDQVTLIQKRTLNVGGTALAIGLGVVVVAAVVVVAVCSVGRYGGRSSGHKVHGSGGHVQPLPPELPLLKAPSQTPQHQTCAGTVSDSKTQQACRAESAVLR